MSSINGSIFHWILSDKNREKDIKLAVISTCKVNFQAVSFTFIVSNVAIVTVFLKFWWLTGIFFGRNENCRSSRLQWYVYCGTLLFVSVLL